MKVADFLQGKTPNPAFEGYSTADDRVLAIDFTGAASDVGDYIAATKGITEASGSLNAATKDNTFLYTGPVTTKTGTARTFTVSGNRYHKDEFQEALLAHGMKFGTGQAVIKPYVYFNMLTGQGEQGMLSIVIDDDYAGAASEDSTFSATLSSTEAPTEYTYQPATP